MAILCHRETSAGSPTGSPDDPRPRASSARMSEAAFERPGTRSRSRSSSSWRRVLNEVVRNKDRRTVHRVGQAHRHAARLSTMGSRHRSQTLRQAACPTDCRWLRLAARSRSPVSVRLVSNGPHHRFAERLTVVGTSKIATLDDATITLDAHLRASGSIVPSHSRPDVLATHLTCRASSMCRRLPAIESERHSVQLRLRLVWENSSWETYLARPKTWTANYEASFAASGEMTCFVAPALPDRTPARHRSRLATPPTTDMLLPACVTVLLRLEDTAREPRRRGNPCTASRS